MTKEERKELNSYLENYGAYDLAIDDLLDILKESGE